MRCAKRCRSRQSNAYSTDILGAVGPHCNPVLIEAMEPQPERSLPSVSLASYLRLLRGNRNFRRLWMAQIVSEIGDWFYTLSIYTLLLQLT